MKLRTSAEYKIFVEEIKRRVRASQYEALKAVNKELIALYWDILGSQTHTVTGIK